MCIVETLVKRDGLWRWFDPKGVIQGLATNFELVQCRADLTVAELGGASTGDGQTREQGLVQVTDFAMSIPCDSSF